MKGWGDKRDWPDVPDQHRVELLGDAVGQLVPTIEYSVALLRKVGVADMDTHLREVSKWARAIVEAATGDDEWASEARATLVGWGKRADDLWPGERWWWSPLGLVCSAWEDERWGRESGGRVPTWLPASTIARHSRVSDRTVRRWGTNRKRVRQRGSVDEGKRRLYHRGDVAKIIVMRYANLG